MARILSSLKARERVTRIVAPAYLFAAVAGLFASPASARDLEIPERRQFHIDSSVNPCDDFYKFACNATIKGFSLPETKSVYNFGADDAKEKLFIARTKLLEAVVRGQATRTPRMAQVARHYQSCVDTDRRAQSEREAVKRALALMAKITTREQMQALLAANILSGSGDFSVVHAESSYSFENPIISDLSLSTDFIALGGRDEYSDKGTLSNYAFILAKFFKAIGAPGAPETLADDVVEIERRVGLKEPESFDLQKRQMLPKEVSREWALKALPNLKLQTLLARLPSNIKIKMPVPEQMKALDTVLKEAPLEALKALYLYQHLKDSVSLGYPSFAAEWAQYKANTFSDPKEPTGKEKCATDVIELFASELDAEMIDTLYPGFRREPVTEIVERVRAAMVKSLKRNKWLSPSARDEAARKIETARLQLVRPEEERHWDYLPVTELSASDYARNLRAIKAAKSKKAVGELSGARDLSKWYSNPLEFNASYSPQENSFFLPQGILIPPMYDPADPEWMNYAGIGATIGHELGHAIDVNGSKYDHTGRLRQWMSNADLAKFNALNQRLVDQFDKIGHDGKNTLAENSADLTGLLFAYEAAFPNSSGTPKQKREFFLQYARGWCEVRDPKGVKEFLSSDPHSLGQARTNEMLKHVGAFAEAFKCKAGDKLVLPEKSRLRIW